LIDPFSCTVTEINLPYVDQQSIYPALSHESMKVDTFTIIHLDQGDVVLVDVEGLLKPWDRFFMLASYHQPIAGKALILGSDGDGDTAPAKALLEMVKSQVAFLTNINGLLIRTVTPWALPETAGERRAAQ